MLRTDGEREDAGHGGLGLGLDHRIRRGARVSAMPAEALWRRQWPWCDVMAKACADAPMRSGDGWEVGPSGVAEAWFLERASRVSEIRGYVKLRHGDGDGLLRCNASQLQHGKAHNYCGYSASGRLASSLRAAW